MHTSKILKSSDFQYWQLDKDRRAKVDFDTFCPNYHELDRVGVVSPCLEDGVLNTANALLALTTAFYDVLRSGMGDFFDYPQHFVFIDGDEREVRTRGGRIPVDKTSIGAAWGQLDVWPDSKWITATGAVTGLIKKVFDFQINRLFWPQDFKPTPDEGPLPTHVPKMLRTRLKAVYHYNTTASNIEIRASQQAADIIQKSIAHLPKVECPSMDKIQLRRVSGATEDNFPYVERYRQVGVNEFLQNMDGCFESDGSGR